MYTLRKMSVIFCLYIFTTVCTLSKTLKIHSNDMSRYKAPLKPKVICHKTCKFSENFESENLVQSESLLLLFRGQGKENFWLQRLGGMRQSHLRRAQTPPTGRFDGEIL